LVISDPAHWKEIYGDDKGDKYTKILEMIADINTNSAKEGFAPASGKRIFLHRFSLGRGSDTIDVTATGGYTLIGSVFTIGKNTSWVADMNAPDITGWTVKYTFSCRVDYTATISTIYLMLYNRTGGSPVTGSDVSAAPRKIVGGFGCSQSLESGYMTEGTNDLDVVGDDGYQFYGYNSAASQTVRIDFMNLNVYLVKD